MHTGASWLQPAAHRACVLGCSAGPARARSHRAASLLSVTRPDVESGLPFPRCNPYCYRWWIDDSYPSSSLKTLADEVCAALQSYVAALGRGLEPDNVVPAMVSVQEAVDKFVTLSVEETGWGTPFLPSPFDEFDEDALSDELGAP
jgi:hypothetical protein